MQLSSLTRPINGIHYITLITGDSRSSSPRRIPASMTSRAAWGCSTASWSSA